MTLGNLLDSAKLNGQIKIKLVDDETGNIKETRFFEKSTMLNDSNIADWKDHEIVDISSGVINHRTGNVTVSMSFISVDVKA